MVGSDTSIVAHHHIMSCIYLSPSIYVFIYVSIYLSIHLSIYLLVLPALMRGQVIDSAMKYGGVTVNLKLSRISSYQSILMLVLRIFVKLENLDNEYIYETLTRYLTVL